MLKLNFPLIGLIHPTKRQLWLVASLLFVAALACSLPFQGGLEVTQAPASATPTYTPAPPTPTPQPLPPSLVEISPSLESDLALNAPVKMYFNQPMNRASVEKAIKVQPAPAGGFSWDDDATLVFNPSQPLPPESELTFTINADARAKSGLHLEMPVTLHFRTSGYLRLAEAVPAPGTQEVSPAAAIIATFNQPVVPLGADSGTFEPAFSLEPVVEGQGEWVNTSTYIFYPDPALEGGRQYVVSMNPGLHSTVGSPLEETAAWSFTTALPRLVSIDPPSGSGLVPLDVQFELSFNQPMDPVSVRDNLVLSGPGGMPVDTAMIWNEDYTRLTMTPSELLEREVVYFLRIGPDTLARGGTSLGMETTASVSTVPELAVISSDPPQGGTKGQYNQVALMMSGPIVDDNLPQLISVEPEVSNLDVYWNVYERAVMLGGDFLPDTSYIVRLEPGIRDPWGGTMVDPYILNFRTAPLEPNLSFVTGGEALMVTTGERAIPVQATNVSTARLTSGPVPLADFITINSSSNGYELRQNLQSPGEKTWNQSFDLVPNRRQTVGLSLNPEGSVLDPGLYYLRYNAGLNRGPDLPLLLVASDRQVTFKLSATEALVWVLNLNTGLPEAGAEVTIYDPGGTAINQGLTNASGIFLTQIPGFDNPYEAYYAVVEEPGAPGFGLAMSYWSQGISSWDFGLQSDFRGPRLEAYLYTDRPIYRPGQTVYFRGVVRQAYNGRYEQSDLDRLQLTLYQNYGEEVASFDLPLSAYGTVAGEYTIPEEAEPGSYRLSSSAEDYESQVTFDVAEYRKPEINLQVTFEADQVRNGEPFGAEISARYFFDAPAGNVKLSWTLLEQPSSFNLPGYQVGVEDYRWLQAFVFPNYGMLFGSPVEQGEAVTDEQGLLQLRFNPEGAEGRTRYILEVTAEDESGLPVSARDSLEVNPGDYYIGVRPETWLGRAGTDLAFEVQVVDWQADPWSAEELRAEFSKVVFIRDESAPDAEFLGPQYIPEYARIGSTDFSTGAGGEARIAFTPPEPGTYQLRVAGGGAQTEVLVWVGGPGQAIWPNLPNQRLRLTPDREDYQPGETARVFVPNPFNQAVPALISIERGTLLGHEVLTVPAGGMNYEIPLTAASAPNVYLSVTLVGQMEGGRPDFRQGFVNLPVEPLDLVLNVNLSSQPERAGPGDTVAVQIEVLDANAQPVEGEFSVAVVDRAVLALADPNVLPVPEWFYGEQPLGVRTAHSLAVYSQRSIFLPAGGGGGGDGMIPQVVRESFPDTAFWEASIVTDAAGKAELQVVLPDSLTTWQILVRGVTLDTRVGEAVIDLVTTKEMLLRPVTPRFLVVGDHVELGAVLQNNSPADLEVQVTLQATGFELDEAGQATQAIRVPADGRMRVNWWGTVSNVDQVELVFAAQGQDQSGLSYTDAARPSGGALPVYRYTAPQTFRTSGVIDEGGEVLELVSLPRSFDPASGSLEVELSSSLSAAVLRALEALEHYPYECTEQTLSRFLPNLETYRVLQEFGIESGALQARLERTLQEGLQRLQSRQNEDGGWSWWARGESDPFITSYVIFGLGRADQAGINLPEGMLEAGVNYLSAALAAPGMLNDGEQLDRLVFSQFALNQAGYHDLAGVEALFSRRDQLSPWAKALLSLTLEALNPGGENSRTLMSDLQAEALRTSTGVHWEQTAPGVRNMSTPVSTSAIVVYALAQRDPASPLLADAVRYLMAHRLSDGSWNSTYSSAWVVMALAEVMRGTGELGGDFEFAVTLNGNQLARSQAGTTAAPVQAQVPIAVLYPDYPNMLSIQREPGVGRLYYTAGLEVMRPVSTVSRLSQGIHITRAYYPTGADCEVESCVPLSAVESGELVEVRLTLTLQDAVYYLLVEDYIPAGTEILDTSLKTSRQISFVGEPAQLEPLYDPAAPFRAGWKWWLFSQPDIYDERIAWASDYLPAGTYELRYTLMVLQPGEYQVLPAHAWQFYFPEVQGLSAGEIFTVLP